MLLEDNLAVHQELGLPSSPSLETPPCSSRTLSLTNVIRWELNLVEPHLQPLWMPPRIPPPLWAREVTLICLVEPMTLIAFAIRLRSQGSGRMRYHSSPDSSFRIRALPFRSRGSEYGILVLSVNSVQSKAIVNPKTLLSSYIWTENCKNTCAKSIALFEKQQTIETLEIENLKPCDWEQTLNPKP